MPTPTLTPTFDSGARGKAMPAVSIPPDRRVDDDTLRDQLPDLGMNIPFVADMLSAALTHERCGRHLYRTVSERTLNPMLKSKYQDFGQETERHVEILEDVISAMGGDPQYVSPIARATEAADAKVVESTFMLAGSIDVMIAEMVMLDAVLMAETIDHANWTAIAALVDDLPAGDRRDQMAAAVDDVMAQEDDHLGWARETRTKLISVQAKSRTMTALTMKAEELVAAIKSWFS